jgi:hypothetical protein
MDSIIIIHKVIKISLRWKGQAVRTQKTQAVTESYVKSM